MEKLINYINRFSLLSASELQIIKKHVYNELPRGRAPKYLKEFALQTYLLPTQRVGELNHFLIKKFKARAFVHEAGTICRRIGFIEGGGITFIFY